ncbi:MULTISPECIES: hypothetical protein [Salinibaculum]|uniref:hypothetical protein n=1 Tax=Salinibaculum TaxID=2732368 RepID=UPI0030D3412F
MSSDRGQSVCRRCGERAETGGQPPGRPQSDPLVVSECPNCGALLSIGGHPW